MSIHLERLKSVDTWSHSVNGRRRRVKFPCRSGGWVVSAFDLLVLWNKARGMIWRSATQRDGLNFWHDVSLAHASCLFQPLLKDASKKTGTARMDKLRDAASALIRVCASDSQGGLARKNLGECLNSIYYDPWLTILRPSSGGENIVLAIGTYGPNPSADESVQCRGRIAEVGYCRDTICRIRVDHQRRMFGPVRESISGVLIPKTVNSCKPLALAQCFYFELWYLLCLSNGPWRVHREP